MVRNPKSLKLFELQEAAKHERQKNIKRTYKLASVTLMALFVLSDGPHLYPEAPHPEKSGVEGLAGDTIYYSLLKRFVLPMSCHQNTQIECSEEI